jgi:hypothetical protein
MDLQALSGVSHTFQTVTVATIIFAACVFLSQVNYRAQIAKLPAIVQPGNREKKRIHYLSSAKSLYAQGYKQVSVADVGLAAASVLTKSTVPRFSSPHCYLGWCGQYRSTASVFA